MREMNVCKQLSHTPLSRAMLAKDWKSSLLNTMLVIHYTIMPPLSVEVLENASPASFSRVNIYC